MARLNPFGIVLALIALAIPAAAEDVPRIKLEKVVQLDKPVEVRHDPAGRLFMVEQTGRALMFENGKVVEEPYLDLSEKVYVAFECGLLGIAFHPKFQSNGLLYASYTTGQLKPGEKEPAVRSVVSEFKVDPKARRVDLATERVVFTLDQPFPNHNGGQIQFGPDGLMYFGFGDGGKGNDTLNAGQDPATWLGKILRIDPTPDPVAKTAYTVPKDNPFVGKEGWKPEIWALGQRNPWRFSFDRQTGDLWAADVGQDIWEEVNLIVKGGNYGWRIREGSHDLWPATPTTTPLIDPVFEYYHDRRAASITGGYVYRGKKIPALQGWYVCGDYSYGTLFGFKYDGKKLSGSGVIVNPQTADRAAGQRPTQPSGFGEDIDGELYMCDINGWVYRIVAP
ncbi:PQQ-dependent sugar dehydrogenase [Humisphaera borealis]|uniref:PQQ-dependent sugar dehydrogenase n=1 Tax=Humisphaera borealis TaxID=2807512 RepID=A0A7M2WZJ7_9BACT|nr:PQQ-dependent sugar dehydrogenase [Humisphaera borealis]QOV90794.1 PQQ-dependent sugar dehydrogenase [Humisphaera borealis]